MIRQFSTSGSGEGTPASVDVISSDNSIAIEKTAIPGSVVFDLSNGQTLKDFTRVTLSQDDLSRGNITLDLGSYRGFILETFDGSVIPSDFVFKASGNIDFNSDYQFSFPNGAQRFILQNGTGTVLIDSQSTFPNGIYSGELLNATPQNVGLWTIESDSDLISSDGSISIDLLNNGRTKNIQTFKLEETYYAKNAVQFNAGVKYLYEKGGGILYIADNINMEDFLSVPVADRQYTLEQRDNGDYFVNFGYKLDILQIKGYKAAVAIYSYNVSSKRFYCLKSQRITVESITFSHNAPVLYVDYKASDTPYAAVKVRAEFRNVRFACDSGSKDSTPVSMQLREHVWQYGDANSNDRPEDRNIRDIQIDLYNCKSVQAFYTNTADFTQTQNEFIVRVTGGSSSGNPQRLCYIGCYYQTVLNQVVPDSHQLKVYHSATIGDSLNYFISAPMLFAQLIKDSDIACQYSIDAIISSNRLLLYDLETDNDPSEVLTVDRGGIVKKTSYSGGGDASANGFETLPSIYAQEDNQLPNQSGRYCMLIRCHTLNNASLQSLGCVILQTGNSSFRLALFDENRFLLAQTDFLSFNQLGLIVSPFKDRTRTIVKIAVLSAKSYFIGILIAQGSNGYRIEGQTVNISSNLNALPAIYGGQNNIDNDSFKWDYQYNERLSGPIFIPYLKANG